MQALILELLHQATQFAGTLVADDADDKIQQGPVPARLIT